MVSEIRQLKLADVATIVGGGTPSTKVSQYWDGAIPWITPKDLSGHKHVYISKGERSISEEGFRASSVKLIPANSVLYTSRAPIGYVAINNVDVTTNQGFKSLIPKKEFDTTYLYYLLKFSKHKVLELASGGTFAEISASSMAQVVLPFPDTKVQKAIGKFALELDQKIQLNIEISETLEQIAQTIFKSWFVDFDPVHSKARGEQPVGMDAETAALFPESFKDSELGLVPRGWITVLLDEMVELTKGKSYKSIELEPSDVALVTLKSFKRGGGYREEGLKPFSGKYKESQIVKNGDLIVAFTDVTQAADVVGKPAIVASTSAYKELVASLDVGIVRPKSPSVSKNFLYLLFLTPEFDNHVRAHASGTTVLHLSADAIPSYKIWLPPQDLMEAFSNIVNPCIELIDSLLQENIFLAKLRNTLLPRLISGELQIPNEMLAS